MIFQLSGVQILEKIGEGNSFFFIWWNVCWWMLCWSRQFRRSVEWGL
jgi:hypothetical protein